MHVSARMCLRLDSRLDVRIPPLKPNNGRIQVSLIDANPFATRTESQASKSVIAMELWGRTFSSQYSDETTDTGGSRDGLGGLGVCEDRPANMLPIDSSFGVRLWFAVCGFGCCASWR